MVQLGMPRVRTGLLALLALLLAGLVPVPVLGANAPGGGPGSAPLMAQPAGLTVRVVRVIDGDTIEVCCLEGGREQVRYIGINAPETRHSTRGEEPGGREAAALNRELVGGRTVRLERDVQERDRYGRLLKTLFTFLSISFPKAFTYASRRFLSDRDRARSPRNGRSAGHSYRVSTPDPRT